MANERGAFIAPGTQIRGRIQGEGELVVEGSVEGTIALSQGVVIEPNGRVDAEVSAPQLSVRGQLSGAVRAGELIAIEADSTVTARLRAPRITVEEGARLVATFEMEVDLPPGVEAALDLQDR